MAVERSTSGKKQFNPNREYLIGQLQAGIDPSQPNAPMQRGAKTLTGEQLINTYQVRNVQELLDRNPAGMKEKVTITVFEISETGERAYFGQGTILPKPVPPPVEPLEQMAVPDAVRGEGGLSDDGSVLPGTVPQQSIPTPNLFGSTSPRPISQSSVYQPAIDALTEQLRAQQAVVMASFEQNKLIIEQNQQLMQQNQQLMQHQSSGLADMQDAASVAAAHAADAAAMRARMDAELAARERDDKRKDEIQELKMDLLRKEMEKPPASTLADITSGLEAFAPFAPVLTEVVRGIFGSGQNPALGPGYPAPPVSPPSPSLSPGMAQIPPQDVPPSGPPPGAVAPTMRMPTTRGQMFATNGASGGGQNAELEEIG